MIEDLLPNQVASVAVRGDDPSASLFPAEARQLSKAVKQRVLEFATGRSCARRALRALGAPETSILCGANREPLWPPGIVGSITHCDGYRAAAVAWQKDVLTVGIDAEINEPLPTDVLEHVAVSEERVWLDEANCGLHRDRLLFSAKECVYKAWFPLTGRWLDFKEARLTFDMAQQSFLAQVVISPPVDSSCFVTQFSGRFLICDGLILTAVTVSRQEVM